MRFSRMFLIVSKEQKAELFNAVNMQDQSCFTAKHQMPLAVKEKNNNVY